MFSIDIRDKETIDKLKLSIPQDEIQGGVEIIVSNQISEADKNNIIDSFSEEKLKELLEKAQTIKIELFKEDSDQLENLMSYFLEHLKINKLQIVSRESDIKISTLTYCLQIIQKTKDQLQSLSIDFSKSNSNVEILHKIGDNLQGLSELTHFYFNFSSNPIGKAKELGKFGKQLEQNSKINKLIELSINMSNMHMGHANVHSYTEFIMKNGQTLKKLDLNLENCSIEKKGTESIKKMIQNVCQVQEFKLNISNNGLMDLFIKDMLRAFTLKNDYQIQRIEILLSGNYLSHEVCEFIHSTFVHNSLSSMTYLHLNLSKNKINNKALEYLSKILEDSNNLKQFKLDVSNSREKIEGINRIVESLNKAKNVQDIQIGIRGLGIQRTDIQNFIQQIENVKYLQLSRFILDIDDSLLQNSDSPFSIVKKDLIFINQSFI
ncbi:hypothetical protein TTHERM_00122360 (macronuclear) [Tetrahymena thermophila SB210]|uniref:Kinase domain protein n=1 Tax=Tetrahymena thermophila (strain SB210) TaxID=312017 RepID=Q22YT4_TETTS|nr:hypothetical protein TTHERM_00122360 [Tetrahymena thermophila SB210]EAR90587.1 hypothetical protein TTHERM_00122360 [Tetrahymena thermophila SB210]|eukprot:XP_001010832.1 hypothetical protein TTHERM_00122360 [Tetrahymena thermophila SB210]